MKYKTKLIKIYRIYCSEYPSVVNIDISHYDFKLMYSDYLEFEKRLAMDGFHLSKKNADMTASALNMLSCDHYVFEQTFILKNGKTKLL